MHSNDSGESELSSHWSAGSSYARLAHTYKGGTRHPGPAFQQFKGAATKWDNEFVSNLSFTESLAEPRAAQCLGRPATW